MIDEAKALTDGLKDSPKDFLRDPYILGKPTYEKVLQCMEPIMPTALVHLGVTPAPSSGVNMRRMELTHYKTEQEARVLLSLLNGRFAQC